MRGGGGTETIHHHFRARDAKPTRTIRRSVTTTVPDASTARVLAVRYLDNISTARALAARYQSCHQGARTCKARGCSVQCAREGHTCACQVCAYRVVCEANEGMEAQLQVHCTALYCTLLRWPSLWVAGALRQASGANAPLVAAAFSAPSTRGSPRGRRASREL